MTKKPTSSDRHQRTRDDHALETAEDYVEAIEEIHGKNGKCRVIDLARQFGVSHVTVTKILKRLAREDLVNTKPYAPVMLTPLGKRMAAKSRRRHEIVFRFLLALGIDSRTAAIDAEGIEHHVSPKTLKQFEQFADAKQKNQM